MSEQIPTLILRGEIATYAASLSELAMQRLAIGEPLRILTNLPSAVEELNRACTLRGDEVQRVEAAGQGDWLLTIHRGTDAAAGSGELSPEIQRDVEEFQEKLLAYFRGEISPIAFKRFRCARGVHAQRQPGVQVVRVRLPAGVVTSAQLRVFGTVAREFGDGTVHVTGRQSIQLHSVPLPRVPALLRAVGAVGLTTREACGYGVRNVSACPLAGVCPDEAFDVTPYAAAVSRHFLRHPLVQGLPRQFKISFSGCSRDCGLTAINDLGLIACRSPATEPGALDPLRWQESLGANGQGEPGFRVVVGGGLGQWPEIAHPLYDFVSVDQLLPTCEAVLRVFDREGNRKNRSAARLKWVIRRMGIERFREEVERERAALPDRIPVENTPCPENPPAARESAPVPTRDVTRFRRWLCQNVAPQRQRGYAVVTVWLPGGQVTHEQLATLADLADRLSDGSVRTTPQQNTLLRWVREPHLPALFNALDGAGLAEPLAGTVADVLACPGAQSCGLSITNSQGTASALTALLHGEAADAELEGATVSVSGCPHACGRHWISTIGLYGVAMKEAEHERMPGVKQVPAYQLLLGGAAVGGTTCLGRPIARIPARRVPQAVRRLLALYRSEKEPKESFPQFAARVEIERVRQFLADLLIAAPLAETEALFIDLGDTEAFRLELGDGECAG